MSISACTAVEEIRAVHERWRQSQLGWNIEEMKACKAKGDNFLQYNLDCKIYRGSNALGELWKAMREHVDLVEAEDLAELNIIVSGDIGVLSMDLGVMRFRAPKRFSIDTGIWSMTFEEEGTEVFYRTTEIYRKDDGTGTPEWRMWRAHYDKVTGASKKAG
jgi:hypothetical protein